jgi:HlyD family secretion protein
MNRKVILPILLIVAGAVGWYFYQRSLEAGDAHRLFGNVDIREVNTSFRVGGRLDQLLVDEGDAVTAGQVLARLDPAPRQVDLDQAKAQLLAAEARLAMLKKGYRGEDVAAAESRVKEARSAAENAQKTYERQDALFKTGAVSRQSRDDAFSAKDEALARQRTAESSLEQMTAGYRPEEVDQAAAEVENAKARVSAADLALNDTTLRAPSDGTVLTRVVEPGTLVNAGDTIVSVTLDKPVYIRAFVEEPRLGMIRPGQTVEIRTDTPDGRVYHGQVGFISSRAEFTPKSVETPELRTSLVYRLRIVVKDSDGALRQGMPVTIQLGDEGAAPEGKPAAATAALQ